MREWQKKVMKCRECGDEFETKNYNQVFCSSDCRFKNKNDYMARAVEHYRVCPLVKEQK